MHSFAFKLDEARRRVDEVQEDWVHMESQQLANAQERIRGLEKDLANTGEVHHGVMMKIERLALAQERAESELKKRKDEQIINSRDRKNLEEEWEEKLEKEKCEHDLELKQLKEEVRSGNQIRGSLEQKIERGEKSLEQRKEELLEKSKQFEELQEEMWEEEERKTELERKHDVELELLKEEVRSGNQIRSVWNRR